MFPRIRKPQHGLGLQRRVILQVSRELGVDLVNVPGRLEVDHEFGQDFLVLSRNIPGLQPSSAKRPSTPKR